MEEWDDQEAVIVTGIYIVVSKSPDVSLASFYFTSGPCNDWMSFS